MSKWLKSSGGRRGAARIMSLILICFAVTLHMTRGQDTGKPDPHAWAIEGRQKADELSYSQIIAKIKDSKPEDRVAVYGSWMIYQDRLEQIPAQEGVDPVVAESPDTDVVAPDVDQATAEVDVPVLEPLYKVILNANAREALAGDLRDVQADVSYPFEPDTPVLNAIFAFLEILLPMAFLLTVFYIFYSRTQKTGKGAVEVINSAELKDGLDDVAGMDAAREEVREIIKILKDSSEISRLGGRPPKGLLLTGAPGTGKTLLARAVAKEAGLNFLAVDAAGLNSLFMGMGTMKIRSIFTKARDMAPCILFFDEFDAIGNRSVGSDSSVGQEKATTINALLTELDGIKGGSGVFVIAATNYADRLDPAVIRPGRIDRQIHIALPDHKGRTDIMRVHCREFPLAPTVDLHNIAGSLPGCSGAQLAALCNEASLLASTNGRKEIAPEDFAEARDRMLVGKSSGAIVLSEDERRTTAWHEAGHAVLAAMSEHADPIEKVTILPGGRALGYVLQVPERDRAMESKARLKTRMKILAGGRAAEIIGFGEDHVTTGAASDIEHLTRIATGMVTRWGMGSAGFVNIGDIPGILSNEDVRKEIYLIAEKAMKTALDELTDNRALLEAIAHKLLETDTMTGAEVDALIAERRDITATAA